MKDYLKNQILDYIQAHGHCTASEIADALPIFSDDPIRIIRKKIRELIIEDKKPIASSMEPPYGYFVVKTSEDRIHYVNQLKARIIAISQRLAAFENATAKKIQLLLFTDQDIKPSSFCRGPIHRARKK